MTTTSLVILGSGVAGASAAIAARDALGADRADETEVVVVDGGSGASTLAPGALDGESDGDLRLPFAGFALGACSVATTAGVVRPASGRDLALLDLDAVSGGVIGVPTSAHHGWDARILAREWNDRSDGHDLRFLRFVPLDATLLRFADERDLPDVDLARRHDDPARLSWLADRLREALARAEPGGETIAALILPPWLGVERPRAEALTALLGLPAGEALATTLGPSGLRFEAARDVAFASRRITVHRARAEALGRRTAGGFSLQLDTGASLTADAVIFALGGLIGGGLRYTPSGSDLAFALPSRGRATVELALRVDPTLAPSLPLGLAGRPLLAPGSLFGASPEQLAWPFTRPAPLERVGLLDEPGTGLHVAGELAADLPRTWLAAVASGQRAGRAAAKLVTSR